MHKRLGILLLLTGSLAQLVCATTQHFNENETLQVSASTSNINRLFVKGDKITQHVAPQGTFIFDRHLSEDGSLYFKPVYLTQTFSLFLTTQKGRHVSVVVTPTTGQGQTLALVPNQAAKADIHWERNSGYLHLLQTMMLSMLQNKPLKGMQKQAVTESRVFSHSKHLQMQLTTIFSGGQLTGLVYRITNTSKYAYRLYERTFYRPGVRAVHLSQQLLKPHHSAWVYTLVAK